MVVCRIDGTNFFVLLNSVLFMILFLMVQDLLEYRKKMRTLKVHMLDGTLKTLLVDDSQPVANLMVVICTKIGMSSTFFCV